MREILVRERWGCGFIVCESEDVVVGKGLMKAIDDPQQHGDKLNFNNNYWSIDIT